MVDQVFNSSFSLPFPPPFHGSLSFRSALEWKGVAEAGNVDQHAALLPEVLTTQPDRW